MTNAELLAAVEAADPELMSKTAEMLSQVAPEFAIDVLGDFETILSMVHEKTADLKSHATSAALAVGGTVAGGLLKAVATDLYDAASRGLTRERNFNRIMEANPGMRRELDSKAVHRAFNTLHKYVPEFTADPLLGGVLVRQLAEMPEQSYKTVVDLIGARKNFNDGKTRHFEGLAKVNPFMTEREKDEKKIDTKAIGEQIYRATAAAAARNKNKKP